MTNYEPAFLMCPPNLSYPPTSELSVAIHTANAIRILSATPSMHYTTPSNAQPSPPQPIPQSSCIRQAIRTHHPHTSFRELSPTS